jgi:hypothetical protein
MSHFRYVDEIALMNRLDVVIEKSGSIQELYNKWSILFKYIGLRSIMKVDVDLIPFRVTKTNDIWALDPKRSHMLMELLPITTTVGCGLVIEEDQFMLCFIDNRLRQINQNIISLTPAFDENLMIGLEPEFDPSIDLSYDLEYGVHMSDTPRFLSGKEAFVIAKYVGVRLGALRLRVADVASVFCLADPSKEISYISMLRILVGKPTIYESLGAQSNNPELASRVKQQLQQRYSKEIDTETRLSVVDLVKGYLRGNYNQDPSICEKMDELSEDIYESLVETGEINAICHLYFDLK